LGLGGAVVAVTASITKTDAVNGAIHIGVAKADTALNPRPLHARPQGSRWVTASPFAVPAM
jgi:hypothetical protein